MNELPWRNPTPHRMIPSRQQFKAVQVTRTKTDKRLKVGAELLVVECPVNVKLIDSQRRPPWISAPQIICLPVWRPFRTVVRFGVILAAYCPSVNALLVIKQL